MNKDVFYIKIADLTVEMRAKYPLSRKRCKDYLCEPVGEPDIIAEVSEEEIAAEIEASEEDLYPPQSARCTQGPFCRPKEGQLQFSS